MKLTQYQVDAFARNVFTGNPAAVVPLEEWLDDEVMQNIAMENNLSETAFFVKDDNRYRLRWFTPQTEVDMCGHATLASGHVLYNHLGYQGDEIEFDTRSGLLTVQKEDQQLVMNFPVSLVEPSPVPPAVKDAFGIEPVECFKGMDYLLVLNTEEEIRQLDPDFNKLKTVETRGFIVTAPGDEVDFVSRFFAPAVGINEDPVTGSAHTILAPYWADKLDKTKLMARQISNRGGEVRCEVRGDRVRLSGHAITFSESAMYIK